MRSGLVEAARARRCCKFLCTGLAPVIWLQVKMRGPDQPPKPTGDPDPRSRPAIQTDPDLTIQTDPDLTIQTYDPDPFVLCWLDIFFKVLNSTTLYYKVLKSTSLYYKVRSWVISWILENLAIPFQTSFQTVPGPFQTGSMESKGSVHSQLCFEVCASSAESFDSV